MKEADNFQYFGTITSPNGFKGKMNIKDVPEGIDKLRLGSKVLCGFSPKFASEYNLLSFSKKENKAIIELKEIQSDKQAFDLKEKGLFTHQKNLIIPQEEVLTDDIIGLEVIEINSDEKIGEIIDVWYLPGNDVWLAKTEKGELPLPVIDQVIKKKDFKNGKILVNIIDGLWDLVNSD